MPPSGLHDELASALKRLLGSGQGPMTLLVAVSGGKDSMLLLSLLLDLAAEPHAALPQFTLEVATIDHRLRPFDAERELLAGYCRGRLPLHIHTLPDGLPERARAAGTSLEEQARNERYEALTELARRRGAQFVILAHHANDQAETLLLNLLRGAGPAGLAGMPEVKQGLFLRPLLHITRTRIDQWVLQHQIPYVDDPTNSEEGFRRNRLRHNVVPAMEAIEPSAVTLMARAAENVRKSASEIALVGRLWLDQCLIHSDPQEIDLVRLLACPVPSWPLREAITRLSGAPPSAATLERCLDLIETTPTGRVPLGAGRWAIRDGQRLLLAPHLPAPPAHSDPVTIIAPGQYHLGDWTISVEEVDHSLFHQRLAATIEAGPLEIMLPKAALPLTLRYASVGERMTPWGMEGTALLMDLLAHKKIPAGQRSSWPLLCSTSQEPLWLVGVRRSALFPASPGSPALLLRASREP